MATLPTEIDRLLRLSTDQAKIKGVLRVEGHEAEGLVTRQSLREFLVGRKVVESCILDDELAALTLEVEENRSVPHERVVARGREPVHGVNAGIEFCDEIEARFDRIAQRHAAFTLAKESHAFEEGPGAKAFSIDFYNESTVIVVAAGDEIARLTPSTPGQDGCNIFGAAVASRTGKDLEGVVDESCVLSAHNGIIAQIDGHLIFQNQKIRINPHLEIAGNVDFSTGNIDFPHDVVIQKGVRDRFRVSSSGDLEVQKLVEAAHLSSHQNIVLHQGMAGREVGAIQAGGDLRSGYLEAVHGAVAGDCHVLREITNCTLRIGGRIDAPGAAIRGGELSVARGGTVGTLGSARGVATLVLLARLPDIELKKRQALDMLPRVDAELEKQRQALLGFRATLRKPSAAQTNRARGMEDEIAALTAKQAKLHGAISRLTQIIRDHTCPRLTVLGMIHAKTEIWLPGFHARFERDIKGECVIALSRSNRPVIERGELVEPLSSFAKVNADERILPLPDDDRGDSAAA